jgi:hypothetical protein
MRYSARHIVPVLARVGKVRLLGWRLASLALPGCELLFKAPHQLEYLAGWDPDSGYDPRGKDEESVAGLGILADVRRLPQRCKVEDEHSGGVPNRRELGRYARFDVRRDLNLEALLGFRCRLGHRIPL